MTKNEERRKVFNARAVAGELTDTIRAWRDRLGNHAFEIKRGHCNDPELKVSPGGPQFKTPQWERTVRH